MRILNSFSGESGNTICFVLCAIHGNEPAGFLAWQQFAKNWKAIAATEKLNGVVVGILGNSVAFENNVRYMDADLNRLFNTDYLYSLSKKPSKTIEDKAALKIARNIQSVIMKRNQQLSTLSKGILLDLHTTSAPSLPFCAVTNEFKASNWTDALGVSVINGLQEVLGDSATINFFSSGNLHIPTQGMLLETGQHKSPEAIAVAYRSIVKTLTVFKMISLTAEEQLLDKTDTPNNQIAELPRSLNFAFRYALQPTDTFEMLPGFSSFDRVTTQTLLAYHNGKPVFRLSMLIY